MYIESWIWRDLRRPGFLILKNDIESRGRGEAPTLDSGGQGAEGVASITWCEAPSGARSPVAP